MNWRNKEKLAGIYKFVQNSNDTEQGSRVSWMDHFQLRQILLQSLKPRNRDKRRFTAVENVDRLLNMGLKVLWLYEKDGEVI